MAPRRTYDHDEAARRYAAGELAKDIAADLGVATTTIVQLASRRGIYHRRPPGWLGPHLEDIADRYQAGESTVAIAAAYGCDPKAIRDVLARNGLSTRTTSEAQRLRYAQPR